MGDRDREQLKALLREYSVRFGQFKLVSGQTSDVYVDAKLTTCRAAAMPLVGRLFLRKIEELGWRPAAVGGLTLGADPIAMAVAHESSAAGRPIDAFVVRKEPKKHGTMKFIEGLAELNGTPVVIIDDVCTTGGSTITAIENARAAGLQILGALCLVDREMGAAGNIEALGCPFDSIFTLTEVKALAATERSV
ncbi:MAG TPA: orotate phosphoribosyltransferase [Bryobacteraceae bacterium]|nr:orotate phosphoribosyltransferase [Bryobacteraceae bacterium]